MLSQLKDYLKNIFWSDLQHILSARVLFNLKLVYWLLHMVGYSPARRSQSWIWWGCWTPPSWWHWAVPSCRRAQAWWRRRTYRERSCLSWPDNAWGISWTWSYKGRYRVRSAHHYNTALHCPCRTCSRRTWASARTPRSSGPATRQTEGLGDYGQLRQVLTIIIKNNTKKTINCGTVGRKLNNGTPRRKIMLRKWNRIV